ncbi:Initiation-specific alpha-1,6-mannosyltransferase [Colletotrichum tanaceti]|uniref:Initiation-specific alpha-1,6-mannosyltransferase n=1 Tax=Colletotrichum tanaceti TaxID=1306861 RepID=A0A4U6XJZ3_9PEZI|nr:Initiation-specific alpha-1,6-mannosyltransferase [Colletotrichum tanaceti]
MATSITSLPHIPPKIWQISIRRNTSSPDNVFQPSVDAVKWLSLHPSYAYTFLDTAGALAAIARLQNTMSQQDLDVIYGRTESDSQARKQKLKNNKLRQQQNPLDLVQLYNAIPRSVMQADVARYAILAVEGGVYSDSDTSPLHPLSHWVPTELRNRTRLIVGMEADTQPPILGTTYPVQLSQWTFAGAKGHPLLWRMIRRVMSEMRRQIEEAEGTEDEQERRENMFSDDDVLGVSGPAGWTEEIYEYLSEVTATEFSSKNLTGLENPTLFGDVLVLPINGFATGIGHSGASKKNADDTMVRHFFAGSWKGELEG